jgi:hypothetical protein
MTHPLFPQEDGFSMAPGRPTTVARVGVIATRDHRVIRAWAERHGAEPALSRAAAGDAQARDVNDGGAAIRFNFPGAAAFPPIDWDEWFERFDREGLTFVHEEEPRDRAYAIWLAKGGGDGHDLADWFEAQRQLGTGQTQSQRYRLISGGRARTR